MRLDVILCKENIFPSRNKACEAIFEGRVLINGKVINKPSHSVESLQGVEVLSSDSVFVSNGGAKLHKALKDFNLNVKDLVFADIGASNGGFTDCLIKAGASKIFAIDVGESQLDKTLINNEKVVVIDNFNARFLSFEVLGEKVDGVTADVSFISLTYVLGGVKSVLKDNGIALLLIKPQFECGKEFLNKNGIVKDKKARILAIKKVYNACLDLGLNPVGITNAPIKENKNKEFILFVKNNDTSANFSVVALLKNVGEL